MTQETVVALDIQSFLKYLQSKLKAENERLKEILMHTREGAPKR